MLLLPPLSLVLLRPVAFLAMSLIPFLLLLVLLLVLLPLELSLAGLLLLYGLCQLLSLAALFCASP